MTDTVGIKITGNEGHGAAAIEVAAAIATILTVAHETHLDQSNIAAALSAFSDAAPSTSGYNTVSGATITMNQTKDNDDA